MLIRIMTIDDYQAVFALWQSTAGIGLRSLDDSAEGIIRFLRRNPNTCFVALADQSVIGAILCGHDGRRGYIYHTAVHPFHQNKGIGKNLVTAALEALKSENIHKVALVSYKDNNLGIAFWKAMGFEQRTDLTYYNKSINPDNE